VVRWSGVRVVETRQGQGLIRVKGEGTRLGVRGEFRV
jgi:hypothetical protein